MALINEGPEYERGMRLLGRCEVEAITHRFDSVQGTARNVPPGPAECCSDPGSIRCRRGSLLTRRLGCSGSVALSPRQAAIGDRTEAGLVNLRSASDHQNASLPVILCAMHSA